MVYFVVAFFLASSTLQCHDIRTSGHCCEASLHVRARNYQKPQLAEGCSAPGRFLAVPLGPQGHQQWVGLRWRGQGDAAVLGNKVGSQQCATCRWTPASLREGELTAGDARLKREKKKDQTPSLPQHLVPCHVYVCSSWLHGTSILPALPWRCSDLQLFAEQDPVSVSCCTRPRPAMCNQAPAWARVPCLGNDGLSSGLHSCPGGVLTEQRESCLPKNCQRTRLSLT